MTSPLALVEAEEAVAVRIATSSGRLLVCVMPCVKFCTTPDTDAPRPTREPA